MDASRDGGRGAGGRWCWPKRLVTAEDWAPYGIGEPDADGWYPDYRPVPEELKPENVAAPAKSKTPDIDFSLIALLSQWQLVVAELAERGVDLYDPAVRRRPWPGIRALIFSLYDSPSRLRAVLTRR
ncbi:hypothetical protein [Microbacterium sp. NPDC058389]|uniref:hypothetical protein n=1 Tax=Microbacterium sp. NPDC058389 TaxID=3346475 RepID=UPI003654C765